MSPVKQNVIVGFGFAIWVVKILLMVTGGSLEYEVRVPLGAIVFLLFPLIAAIASIFIVRGRDKYKSKVVYFLSLALCLGYFVMELLSHLAVFVNVVVLGNPL